MAAPPIAERHRHHFHRQSPIKESVRVATTANITIATALNNGDTLDGITLATDDRVLVKDQSTGAENGIYVVGVTPVRAYDVSSDDPAFGFLVYVRAGTANAETLWVNTNTSAPTIDTTALTFEEVAGGGTTITVEEVDGSPTGAVTKLVLPNGTVGIVGATATYTPTAGGGGGLVLLEQQTASASASLNFAASISATYDDYMIEVVNLKPATNGAGLWMRMGTGGGPTYDSSALYGWSGWRWFSGGSGTTGASSGASKIELTLGSASASAYSVSGTMRLHGPGSADYKNVIGHFESFDTPANGLLGTMMIGTYLSATAVTAFQFLMSSGNIAVGTIRVYGIEK